VYRTIPSPEIANSPPAATPASVSAILWGTQTTTRATIPITGGVDAVRQTVEGVLASEAARTGPMIVGARPRLWEEVVRVKQIQVHDGTTWVDLTQASQLQCPEVHLFVLLTTPPSIGPKRADVVALAPGHAPELKDRGCLQLGECGVVAWHTGGETAGPTVVVRGPREDTFTYFADDLVVVSGGGALPPALSNEPPAIPAPSAEVAKAPAIAGVPSQAAPDAVVMRQPLDLAALQAEIDRLQEQKFAAAAAEDFAEAKRLKEQVDSLVAKRVQWEQRRGQVDVERLKAHLRLGMCHADAARQLHQISADLHAVDPQAVYSVIAEFQPTLPLASIARTWRKIIEIYQAHARRSEQEAVGGGQLANYSANTALLPISEFDPEAGDELAGLIRGVIDFIDQPLSPKSLRAMRHLRRSCSPARER